MDSESKEGKESKDNNLILKFIAAGSLGCCITSVLYDYIICPAFSGLAKKYEYLRIECDDKDAVQRFIEKGGFEKETIEGICEGKDKPLHILRKAN